MSTVLLVVLVVIVLFLYGVYRLLKWILKRIKKSLKDRKYAKDYARAVREAAEFEASIVKTNIIDRRKVFDSNRKYHYETTFMIYFKNNKKAALTVQDGSYQYDAFMSKLVD